MRVLDELEGDFRRDPGVFYRYRPEIVEHLKAFMGKAENLSKAEEEGIWGFRSERVALNSSTKERTAKREPRSRGTLSGVLVRTSEQIRSARAMDQYALKAWIARVKTRSEKKALPRYVPGTVDLRFMTDVAKRSRLEHGPLAAQHYLAEHGVSLVIEPQLPKTYLDGAALLLFADKPVIGMTLRYDQLDKFWFCLCHELAHIALHCGDHADFIDDLDVDAKTDPKEREADELAGEALIPERDWVKSLASRLHSPEAAEDLAKQLGIHTAIVAGRMPRTSKSYRLLNNLVGHKEVRREFSQIEWPAK
jgi:HTH-type transcriptional regulator/antitoxin HigA